MTGVKAEEKRMMRMKRGALKDLFPNTDAPLTTPRLMFPGALHHRLEMLRYFPSTCSRFARQREVKRGLVVQSNGSGGRNTQ